MTSERTKAMDDLIAQDADLIDTEVTDEDREVFIRLSGPDDETAQRIRRGLIYTWEVRQIATHRQKTAAYWYRQGKDDGWQMCKENEIDRLREELAEAYIKLSGKSIHTSDCATSNAPAMEPGPCNCDAPGDADLVAKLRDTDSYYRLQEKHWCIDAEELERQRLAAADRIEHLEAENERLREALGFAMRTLEAEGFSNDGPTLTRIRAAIAGDSHD